MRITRLLFVGFWVASSAVAQVSTPRLMVPKKLPDDLQASFEERMSQFITAQAAGRGDEIGELLGRRGLFPGKSNNSYTDSYKRCLVKRIQELRMVDFDFSIQDLSISMAAYGWRPAGGLVDRFTAEQSLWHLKGTGRFRTLSESWMEQVDVMAYREQGQWYFIPPQRWMQDKWEKAHYTEADFVKDRRAEVDVRNNPSTPVEITDVHVYMEREHPSLRKMTFKLRNKTSKRIDAVGVSITGYLGPIQPKGLISGGTGEFLAYEDFCDGMMKQEVSVEDVHFSDGSRWVLNKEWLLDGRP